jgi:hypothetical protein
MKSSDRRSNSKLSGNRSKPRGNQSPRRGTRKPSQSSVGADRVAQAGEVLDEWNILQAGHRWVMMTNLVARNMLSRAARSPEYAAQVELLSAKLEGVSGFLKFLPRSGRFDLAGDPGRATSVSEK